MSKDRLSTEMLPEVQEHKAAVETLNVPSGIDSRAQDLSRYDQGRDRFPKLGRTVLSLKSGE